MQAFVRKIPEYNYDNYKLHRVSEIITCAIPVNSLYCNGIFTCFFKYYIYFLGECFQIRIPNIKQIKIESTTMHLKGSAAFCCSSA
jgi:hypothetical protein